MCQFKLEVWPHLEWRLLIGLLPQGRGKQMKRRGKRKEVALVNELKNKKKQVKEEYVHHMNPTGHLQRLISSDFCVVVPQIWH